VSRYAAAQDPWILRFNAMRWLQNDDTYCFSGLSEYFTPPNKEYVMHFRKPELIPVLFIIAAEIVLIGLGGWQVERLAWKNNLISAIEKAQAEAPLTGLSKDISALEYRNVELKGHFSNEKTLREVGGKQDEKPGFFLLTPFTLGDGSTILVNRGFAPEGKAPDAKGAQTVKGVLRPLRIRKLFFLPDNQPEKNIWISEDINAMSAKTGVTLLPLIIEATGPHEKNIYPIPSDGKIVLRNDHLGYAITWFSLALIGMVLFGIYYREKRAVK
jgi:surfeit locus 1 family protein